MQLSYIVWFNRSAEMRKEAQRCAELDMALHGRTRLRFCRIVKGLFLGHVEAHGPEVGIG